MAVHTDDTDYQTVGADATDLERYDEVRLENEKVLIYDREDESAWIQSNAAVDLESML